MKINWFSLFIKQKKDCYFNYIVSNDQQSNGNFFLDFKWWLWFRSDLNWLILYFDSQHIVQWVGSGDCWRVHEKDIHIF